MANSYLETLNKAFDESVAPNKDKLMVLMDETMTFFQEIKAKLESKDPAVREAAFQETLEMKRILESKMRMLSEKTGLDAAQLAALAEDTNTMSPEERVAVEEVKTKFQQLQNGEKQAPKNKSFKTNLIS